MLRELKKHYLVYLSTKSNDYEMRCDNILGEKFVEALSLQ